MRIVNRGAGVPNYAAIDKGVVPSSVRNELIPFLHRRAFLRHVGPAVVIFRAHVLKRVVLDTIPNFLRYTGLASERFPSAPHVTVCHERDCVALTLAPREGIERLVLHRL